MKKRCLLLLLTLLMVTSAVPAYAGKQAVLRSPAAGVLCDRYMCVNDKGISRELTGKYIGEKAVAKIYSQGDFDPTQFTFANGIFCDVKERQCRDDRYFGADGKRSGALNRKYTELLFGQ
jgi:hypothetical protein